MNAENSVANRTVVLCRPSGSRPHYFKEREAFLEHLLQQGTSLAAARGVSWQLLNVIRLLQTDSIARCVDQTKSKKPPNVGRQQRANPFAHSYKHSASLLHLCSEEVAALRWRAEAACDSAHAVRRSRSMTLRDG